MQIKGIKFTEREVDIIACILHLKGSKKIAQILNISPRTIEGHIQNILHKIGVNSQENIKEKIEESSEIDFVKRRYIQIQIKSLFFEKLKQIKPQIDKKNLSCVLDTKKYPNLKETSLILQQAGVLITGTALNGVNSKGKFEIIELDNKNTKLVKNANNETNKKILVCCDKRIPSRNHIVFESNIIDNTIQDKKYEVAFRILKILIPSLRLDDEISRFNQLRENTAKLKFESCTESDKNPNHTNFFSRRGKIMTLIISVVTICIIVSATFYAYKNGVRDKKETQGLNFVLLHKNILLKREDIGKKLDNIFKKNEEISVGVLAGAGGVGKTTTARDYTKNQKASIVWEFNAETKDNTLLGFENLAYALCRNDPDRKELRHIVDTKDGTKRESRLLLFVQKQLKTIPNWFLIFDNIENVNEISSCIPQDKEVWGFGGVIITTRNANIENSDILSRENIINIGEITATEKLQLFTNITKDLPYKTLHIEGETRDFLEKIPSFPLDVSIAAHYLKDTGMQYRKYIEELESSKKEFTALQTSILKDASQYNQTRYSIISLTLKKMMESNSEFYDLYLLLGVLDSQDIPQELLSLYKNKYIANNFLRSLKQNSLITNIQYNNDKSEGMDNLSLFSIHRSTQDNILANAINSLNDIKKHEELKKILDILQTYILREIDIENSAGLKNIIRHCKSLEDKEDILGVGELLSIKNGLGIIYYYLGNDQLAKKILENNLDESKEDQETALALTHLGAIYRKLGQDYTEATKYLEKAISIYNKISPNSPRKALALTHLGNTYRTLGEFTKATDALKTSVKIYHNTQGYYSGEARAIGYLGVVYREQSNLQEAKNLLEKAVDIYKKEKYPKHSAVYAGTLAHLGITYRMIGEYNKAKEVLEDSLVIYEQIRPKDHPDIGRNVQNLGVIYGEIGDHKKAEALLVKSARDYEKNYGTSHIETGKVLNHLGRFYTLSKNYNKSEESLERASQILESKKHPESYRSYELLGDLYKEMAQPKKEIIEKYNHSLELALKYFDKKSANIERINNKINALQKD